MGKTCQFARHTCTLPFPNDNLSKCQSIFTKLGMCIVIMENWLGIAHGHFLSVFDSYLPGTW